MTVLNVKSNKSHTETKAFLDVPLGTQRYDTLKYKQFDKLTEKQLGFFWLPQEIDCNKDNSDFKELTIHEQHIFTSNLKRQIVLDSVQGRSPNLALLPLVTLPELEGWIETWAFSELIHSRSYTHIIRNVYSQPSKVFDDMNNVKEIMECAVDISKYYDDLIEYTQYYKVFGPGKHTIPGNKLGKRENYKVNITQYELKKKLWLCLNSINILEGIRFYVSFACSWAFAELKKMEGNAKIIKFIARDENLHLASTQYLLSKVLPKDDKDFVKIAKECNDEVTQMFVDAVEQEKKWAKYLFKDGSMIGLNTELLSDYIEWICCKRMTSLGMKCPYVTPQANPLPWTQKWISGGEVQVAPQETEISSYVTGGVNKDVSKDTFKGFSL
jgi:ribonucleoside-diphosphate reductase beta chain